jgi:hypothetical protein
MPLIRVDCKDCAGYGRETWTLQKEVSPLTEEELDGAFYAVIFDHHRATHTLNTQTSKADGGDNCYEFYLGMALIGHAAVSSHGKHFHLNPSSA